MVWWWASVLVLGEPVLYHHQCGPYELRSVCAHPKGKVLDLESFA